MITIQLENDNSKKLPLNKSWIDSICKLILNNNGHKEGDITIIFTTDKKVSNLKKYYFHQDVFTDTISFNLEDEGQPIEGEIYISLDRVFENAKNYNQEYIQECKRVIIHSCLHLIGYDDIKSEDKTSMTAMEEQYLNQSNYLK